MRIASRITKGFLVIVIGLLLISTQSQASKSQRKQIRIKAAFIFQMAKFVNWRYDAQKPLQFCFHKDNRSYHVFGALSQLQSKSKLIIENRQINLKLLNEQYKEIQHYQSCDLVYFIPRLEKKIPTAILKELGRNKLLVGNSKAFLAKGGLSALIVEQGKNRLYINRQQYQQSRVKIRSRLMKLARMYPQ